MRNYSFFICFIVFLITSISLNALPKVSPVINIEAWNSKYDITKFKFFERVKTYSLTSAITPSLVVWPVGTVQNFGSSNCGSVNFTVSTEVFLAGVTDMPGQGNNIHCVVHLGKVANFGGGWNCIQNFDMNYVMENGLNDVFTATISNLPPGLYEFTCACSDQGVFVNPIGAPGVAWIGDFIPPNTFANGQFTVNATAPNDDCSGALVNLNQGSNSVDNNCSIDGMVGFQYTVTSYGPVSITAATGSLGSPTIGLIRQGMPCSGPGIDPTNMCFAPGTVLYIQAGNNITPCTEYGDFTINVTELASPVTANIAVTEMNGTNDGNVCIGSDFTLTVTPVGAAAYSWSLDGTPFTNTTNTWNIPVSTLANDGTYTVTVTDAMGCTGSTSITVNILSLPTANPATLETCEDVQGSGSGSFTLTDADGTVSANAPGVTVTYHINAVNANGNIAPLSSPYTSNPGTIFARVTDASGCYAVSTVTLTVHPLPTGVQIQNINNSNSPADFTICAGQPIDLNVAGTGSGTLQYNWDLPGGTATGSPLNITSANTGTHSGLWTVTVTDGNGCTATDNINITVEPAPSNDDCGNALPFTTSGDNSCASQDLAVCGSNGEASVWYDYTVPGGIKTLTFTLSGLIGGVLNVYDGCGGTAIGTTCSNTVTIDCPDAGDVYKVFVSSPTANTGTFTLSATETPVSASNDECSGAIVIPDAPICQFFPVAGSTSVGACPENFTVAGCGLDYSTDAIVWYEFTPPVGTTSVQIQNVTGTLSIFNGCPATTVVGGGGCLSGAATINVTAGTTYYVGIGVPGGSGPVGFEIRYNAGPVNDNCGAANIDLGSSGSATSTNACAGPDFSFNCAASTYESSVWFTVTVDAGSSGIEFRVNGSGANPMTGSGSGLLVQSGCSNTAVGEGCFTVGSQTQILCIPPGTYDFQIATSTANAGDFSISVSQLTGGPSSPPNDLCENATNAPLPLVCAPVTISGNNTNACNEIFSIGGCNFGTDPTTWHTITVDANASTIDITNITGGAYLGVFQVTPCGTNNPPQLPGAGCVTSNTTGVPVTGGATYYIAVGHVSGTAYSFAITQNVPPPNDTPCSAETIGTATQNSTCCANQEVASPCGAGTEASVWYMVPTGPNVVSVDVTFANTSMSAPFVVDIFSGPDCSSLSILPDDVFRSPCNSGGFTANIRCQDFETNNLYIRVGSNAATCGTFNLSAVVNNQTCNAATNCGAAPTATVGVNSQVCIPGCNASVCGDGACDPNGNVTYYAFNVDPAMVASVVIQINGASFTPIISIANDCFSPFVSCFTGSISDPVPSPTSGVLYVRVEALGGINLDDSFDVCAVGFDGSAFDCYNATLTVTRPEHPTENPNGPYCSGEVVNFCYNVNFIVSPANTVPPNGNNCQWLQGIVPVVYEGWDLVTLPLSSQAPPGGANWLAEGVVHYNFASPQYSPFTLPSGDLGLSWGAGGLAAGGAMPAGWYWASPGSGVNCTDGSNPDTAWGLPGACGSTQNVTVCFNLKVKEFQTEAECQAASLRITMFSFADGELGCWTQLSCALSTPLEWNGQAACNSLITITADDKETCTGVPVLVTATANDPNADIILTAQDNPNVTGETLSGTFPFGQMNLLETLINTSNVPQIVRYTLYGVVPGQVCQSPPIDIEVTVYPELEGTFIPDPVYVCNPGECTNLTINPIGGTGNYVNFQWSGQGVNGSGQTVQVCPITPTVYTVTFTDDLGCVGTEEIEVTIKDPVIVTIDPVDLSVCKDGIESNTDPIFASVNSGEAPFTLTWTTPPGINGYGSPFFTPWDDRFVLLEESSQNTSGTLLLTVTDTWGCTGTATAFISIDAGPQPTFTHLPVPCGSNLVDLVATFFIGSSSTGLDRFELYGCDDTFIASLSNNTSTFPGVDMSVYGTCFKLLTYTGGGCVVTRTINVATVSGTQVLLSGNTERCANGATSQINVSNPASFTSFSWSNGANTADITVTPSTTTTYVVTATQSNGCTSTASRTITVHPAPIPSFSGSTSICPGQTTTLTGSSDIPGSTFTWTNLADGVTQNGASISVSTASTYSLTVVSPFNCTTILTPITITVGNTLSPNINELTICDGTPGILDAGSGFDVYLWSTGETTQSITVTAGGQYFVDVAQATCFGSDTVIVTNNLTPSLNLPPSPIVVCRTDDGFGPSSVDFTSQLSPAGVVGTWREITGSGVDFTTNPNNVSFLGIAAGNYQFEFTTSGAVAPCSDVSDTLFITVNACQCPQILPTGPLCNQGSAPVDMKTRKGNPALGGTFSVISPAGITMVNDIFNPTGLPAGTYTIQWSLTPNCQPTINVIVYDDPVAALTTAQTTICNDNATGITTLDVSTLLTSNSSPGTWKFVSGPSTAFTLPSIIDGTGLTKDEVIIVRYVTNSAQSPCRNDSIDLRIIVRDCKCPDVTITPLSLCNGDNTQIDLNGSSILTVNPAGTTGTWTSNIVGAVTGGQFLNVFGRPTGSYTVTFTLTNPIVGCTNAFTAPVTIALQPVAVAERQGNACNINSGNGPTTVRLFDLLRSGYTTSGVWTQTGGSPTLPIDANGNVDFVAQPVGSIFRFTYTRTATAPCTPVSEEVTVTVSDCQCPPINISNPGPLCNSDGLLDMNSLQGIPNSPGTWLVRSQTGNIVNTPGDILDAKGLQEGIYRLTYSLVPAPAGTCQRDSTVTLRIEKQNEAVTKDTVMCNTISSQGSSSLDLRSLVVATTGSGIWVDQNFEEVTNFTNVDFIGQPLGINNYYYQVASNAPCVNISVPARVEVIDCSCEQIILGQIPSLCTASATFDLRPFNDPKPGTWKSNNPIIIINNGVLNLTNLPAGMYDIFYELNTPLPAPCPSSRAVTISVFNPKNAGAARGAEYCVGATDVVNLFDRLDNEDTGGTWTVVSGGSVGFNAQNGTFNLVGRPAGTYVFRYSFTGQTPCPDDQEDVTIKINDLPIANAGADKTLNCTVQSALLGTTQSSSGVNIVYEWKLGNDIVSNLREFTVLQGGLYTLTVRDTVTKCSSTDNVTVILEDDLPLFDVAVDTIACFGQTASIQLLNIRGGQPPYQISFNGGTTYATATAATNLKSGVYKIMVRDANGCVNDRWPEIVIIEPPLFTLNLGPDLIFNLGDDTLLSIAGQYNPLTALSVKWFANGVEIVSNQNLPTLAVKPDDDTQYSVTVVNQSGCIATDDIRITIRRVKPECIPNIISFGSASGNAYFSINCDEVELVTKYSIYDRWGNLLFLANGLSPNNPQTFWNGTFKGKEVVPGVYVYHIELLFKDGSTESRAGDVTVLR